MPLPTNLICRYQNPHAGHNLRVQILTPLAGRMYLVRALEKSAKLDTRNPLSVHENDLHADN